MVTEMSLIKCSNNFRCWECTENCQLKKSFLLPDELFMASIHECYSANIGFLITLGRLTAKEAKQIVDIKLMSVVTARKKFLETLNNQ